MTPHILQPLTNFLHAGCHFRIAQVEYQGQTRYTRLLDSKYFDSK